MYDVSAIANYIHFLKTQCGLYISLHPATEKEHLISSGDLMVFNFHENSYCIFVKRNLSCMQRCLQCQKKVMDKCENGAFNGTCFAGVRERVYPITDGKEVTGFISVSGYQTDNAEAYLSKLVQDHHFSLPDLQKVYGSLMPNFPDSDTLDAVMVPLCQMLELAYRTDDSSDSEISFIEKVIRFIEQNHNQDITSEDICKQFYCSRSFMSTQFNKATGKSIRTYINELRISDAKNLLQTTNLSVTEIGYLVGFSNSNYFSEIFKNQVGMPPLKYRKTFRKLDCPRLCGQHKKVPLSRNELPQQKWTMDKIPPDVG